MELKRFIDNPIQMKKLRGKIVNCFGVPAEDVDGIVFETLIRASQWWEPNKGASFRTAVFTTLPSVAIDYFRRNRGPVHTDYNDTLDYELCSSVEKEAHFRSLLTKVEQEIDNVENPRDREIIRTVLLDGARYDEFGIPAKTARKIVSRFRKTLRDKYNEEMYW